MMADVLRTAGVLLDFGIYSLGWVTLMALTWDWLVVRPRRNRIAASREAAFEARHEERIRKTREQMHQPITAEDLIEMLDSTEEWVREKAYNLPVQPPWDPDHYHSKIVEGGP